MTATKRKPRVERFSKSSKLDKEVARMKARVPAIDRMRSAAEIVTKRFRVLPSLTSEESAAEETRLREERERQLRELEEKRWQAIYRRNVPAKFRGTFDIEQVEASVSRAEINEALGWQLGVKGLWIVGDTGHSKSWLLYELLGRLILKERRNVVVFDGVSFSNACSIAFSDPSQTERWLQKMVRVEILVIDDIAKRFTPAAQQGAFAIFDRRSAALKPPVLATSNYSSDDLRAIMHDQSLADPMIRRLREYSQLHVF
jgi:DNA replication protein DnaC